MQGAQSSSPGQGTGFHTLQLKILCATTKTQSSQINEQIILEKEEAASRQKTCPVGWNIFFLFHPSSHLQRERRAIVTTFPVFLFCCYSVFSLSVILAGRCIIMRRGLCFKKKNEDLIRTWTLAIDFGLAFQNSEKVEHCFTSHQFLFPLCRYTALETFIGSINML